MPVAKFQDKICLITGGTSGIGLAIAARLIAEGARAVITGRDEQRGQEALKRLGGHARLVTDDVREAGAARRAVQACLDHFGRLDCVVVSAGIGLKETLLNTTQERLLDILHVNVVAAVAAVQEAAPHLPSGGSAVLIASDAGILGEAPAGAYSVSKAALIMAGKMLAVDLAPRVRVNIVCPGDTAPGMRTMLRPGENVRDPQEYLSWPTPPLGRLGAAEDVASAVSFLLSADAGFIAGATLLVDGGARAAIAPTRAP